MRGGVRSHLGEERVAGEVIIAMGWVQLGLNDLAQSRRLFERALVEKSDANDRYGVCAARQGLATVALREGCRDEAFAEFIATLEDANELQLKDYVARAIHGLAAIQALEGATELAARLLGFADRLFAESGRELRDSIAYDIAAQCAGRDAAGAAARRAARRGRAHARRRRSRRAGRRPWETPGMSARSAALALAIAASCTACSRVATAPPHELRIADTSDPSSLNPLLAHDQDTIGLDLLFVQTLVGLDAENRLVPVLVTRVPSRANGDISPDGRTIVYRLRRDARFADGRPVTSADVAFTFHAIEDPRNPVLSEDAYRRVAALTTPDAHTVVVRLRAPWDAAVRELFAQSDFAFGILPAHAFASTALQGAPWEAHAFGSGPFRVTQWRRGERVVLEPNPYYSPRPRLSRIELRMTPTFNAVLIGVRTGELDVGRVETAQVAEAPPGLHVVATALNGMDYLALQTAQAPTDDVAVRRAMALALDVPVIERPFQGSTRARRPFFRRCFRGATLRCGRSRATTPRPRPSWIAPDGGYDRACV